MRRPLFSAMASTQLSQKESVLISDRDFSPVVASALWSQNKAMYCTKALISLSGPWCSNRRVFWLQFHFGKAKHRARMTVKITYDFMSKWQRFPRLWVAWGCSWDFVYRFARGLNHLDYPLTASSSWFYLTKRRRGNKYWYLNEKNLQLDTSFKVAFSFGQ